MAHSLSDSSLHPSVRPSTHRPEVLHSVSGAFTCAGGPKVCLGEATTPARAVWHNPLGKCKDTVTSEASFAVFEAGGGQLGRTLGVGDRQYTWIDVAGSW